MKISSHCEECKAYLGKPFLGVHKWLDEFQTPENTVEHREQRHNKQGIEELLSAHSRKDAGQDELRLICIAAVLHIISDYYGPRSFIQAKKEFCNENNYYRLLERVKKSKLIPSR